MATAIKVHLPRHHRARFPDRCVVCGAALPGSTLQLKTDTSISVDGIAWLFRKVHTVDAPACRECARWLRVRRFFDILLLVVVVIGAVWLAAPPIARLGHIWGELALCGVGVAAILPMLFWRALRPYPIGLSATPKSFVYEFLDEAAAHEFAELNRDAQWVEIK